MMDLRFFCALAGKIENKRRLLMVTKQEPLRLCVFCNRLEVVILGNERKYQVQKVSNLQAKVDCFEAFKTKQKKKRAISELEDGLDFANAERESAILNSSGTRNYTWKFTRGGKIFAFSELKKNPIWRRMRERFWLDSLKKNLVWKIKPNRIAKGPSCWKACFFQW